MSKSYTTNLTQEQWELIEALIPPPKKGGRNREVDIWAVINAIFYIVTQGCTWRNLPILDFGFWIREKEKRGSGAQGFTKRTTEEVGGNVIQKTITLRRLKNQNI